MATRAVLAELAAAWAETGVGRLQIESVGGVDAARRVREGERFDLVFLAADAIDALTAEGHLQPGSRTDLMRSPIAAAVRAGAPVPDIATEAALRDAVLAAASVAYSTGPSGRWLQQLFTRWGLADTLAPRTVKPPPGVPVGRLVAQGEVALGFQQLSELMALPGLTLLGPLPPEADFVTVFSAALPHRDAGRAQEPAAHALLRFLNAPASVAIKQRHGMQPALA